MSGQPISRLAAHGARAAAIVAKYNAIIVREIIWSELAVFPEAAEARAALAERPRFVSRWPPHPAEPHLRADTSSDVLILFCLKALFDFGAQLPDDAAGSLAAQIERRWPDKRRPHGRISVDAVVRADGQAEWGYERAPSTDDDFVDGVEPVADGVRTDFDLFVQNMVRSDIAAKLTGP